MNQIQQRTIFVPASLIEAMGTGPDTDGLIGKQVRLSRDPFAHVDPLLRLISGAPNVPVGAVGTVAHIDAEGQLWVDFGDNEDVRLSGPEGDQARIMGCGDLHALGDDAPMIELVTK